jgi:hypothetical protein
LFKRGDKVKFTKEVKERYYDKPFASLNYIVIETHPYWLVIRDCAGTTKNIGVDVNLVERIVENEVVL